MAEKRLARLESLAIEKQVYRVSTCDVYKDGAGKPH